jgi:hypothetical protein
LGNALDGAKRETRQRMQHSNPDKIVNKLPLDSEQLRDLESWEQLGIPLARVLTDIAKRIARENGGEK